MNTEIDDGGAAFPRLYALADEDGRGGMTLRDWFAGMALQGMLADPNFNETPYSAAELCYQAADAMIEVRNQTKQ